MSLTKQDLQAISDIVDSRLDAAIETKIEPMMYRISRGVSGEVCGDIVGQALESIQDLFIQQENKFNIRFDRIENKLDLLTIRVDRHDIDIKELQMKLA